MRSGIGVVYTENTHQNNAVVSKPQHSGNLEELFLLNKTEMKGIFCEASIFSLKVISGIGTPTLKVDRPFLEEANG